MNKYLFILLVNTQLSCSDIRDSFDGAQIIHNIKRVKLADKPEGQLEETRACEAQINLLYENGVISGCIKDVKSSTSFFSDLYSAVVWYSYPSTRWMPR